MNQANQYKKDSGKKKEIHKLITTNDEMVIWLQYSEVNINWNKKWNFFSSIKLTQTTVKGWGMFLWWQASTVNLAISTVPIRY